MLYPYCYNIFCACFVFSYFTKVLVILGLVSLRSFYFRRCRGVSKILSHSVLHMFTFRDFVLGFVDFRFGELEVFFTSAKAGA